LSSIGDIILATALIRCVRLRFPDARIDFIVKEQFFGLVKNNPHLNTIHIFSKGESLKELRSSIISNKYDWLIDIHQNFRSLYLKTFNGIPLMTGYSKQLFYRSLLVDLGINLYRENKPVILRYFEAVEKQGVTYDGKGTEVFISSEDVEFVRGKLRQKGFTEEMNLYVLCPGASFSNKRWMPEGFAAVTRHLIDYWNGFIALAGGAGDMVICKAIAEKTGGRCVNVAGEFTLLQSAALMSECRAFIGNDSGMLHLAQAFRKPVVGIYGPTVKELGYFPLPHKSLVVEKALPCRPCTHNGLNHCPKKHFRCMNEIDAKDVITAFESLVEGEIGNNIR
jgi:heptosyltransferase-2